MQVGPIVIIGADGQLGSDLSEEFGGFPGGVELLTHRDVELCDYPSVGEALGALGPSTVVNTAAFHKLEACESDIERAFAVNSHAVRHLASVCERLGCRLIHFSTDYVFSGTRTSPYDEFDAPQPLNVYGVSKAAGEHFVQNSCSKYAIVRTSGLFGLAGSSGKGGNFVETMLRLGRQNGEVSVVTDQVLSPTYTRDLARVVRHLAEAGAQGTYHVTSSGECSWYQFARAIFEIAGDNVEVKPVTSEAFGSDIARPAHSVLDNRHLREEGIPRPRHWKEALEAYLEARENQEAIAIQEAVT